MLLINSVVFSIILGIDISFREPRFILKRMPPDLYVEAQISF
ncbi:protein of unknown function [Maridesulfovibrio hydrothermalis AM13 = DSM 14728]|uniref:Uncharacterized protein n=1 Tax=Maridesulfovibrio hydrothermalis AM13 = DSM 14728 TaxID=1121451 RepID=L0R7W7_9BACT|nr:protein of unknown function [Maridesulfovibrio hydrothermalis AM13 = DSM 14728]